MTGRHHRCLPHVASVGERTSAPGRSVSTFLQPAVVPIEKPLGDEAFCRAAPALIGHDMQRDGARLGMHKLFNQDRECRKGDEPNSGEFQNHECA
jgi:hypothetical protein